MRGTETVRLSGGPFDGRDADVRWGQTLIAEGAPLEEGMVARYRPSRERGVYRFREYDRIVLRIRGAEPASREAVA